MQGMGPDGKYKALLIDDESERRCLTAWAWCPARKGFFKNWCKEEGIHPETGRRRKEGQSCVFC